MEYNEQKNDRLVILIIVWFGVPHLLPGNPEEKTGISVGSV